MVENVFSNISGFIQQYREDDFEGFTVDLYDDRDFQQAIQDGEIDQINLYDTVQEKFYNKMDGFNSWLKGQEVGLFVKGSKIAETEITESDLRFGGSSESFGFEVPENWDTHQLEEAFPNVAGNTPEFVHNIRDMARAFDIKQLSFKPLQETQNTGNTVTEQASNSVNNTMSENYKLGLGLIAAPIAIYTLYKVVS